MTDIDDIFDNEKNWSNLENNVAKILRQFGWNVKENQPYLDPNTDKQREIDIIASKEYAVWSNDRIWIKSPETLEMRLFIDCKNLPKPLWLYVRDKDNSTIMKVLFENRVYRELYGNYFDVNEDVPDCMKTHRFLSDSKLAYKSIGNDEKSIGIQWVNQVIHAMLSPIYPTRVTYNIDYTVIIVNDERKLALEHEDGSRSYADKNILYGIDYIVNKRKKYFVVDIVSLNNLQDFLKELDTEFDSLKNPIYQILLRNVMDRTNNDDEDGTIVGNIWNQRF